MVADLGYYGRQGEHIVVVENTPEQHNMVVCTLCSCYPWPLLGIPPGWYKSDAYRARAVREPRKVLAEFGVTLPDTTSVRVWDSTAEIRYLVLPMRPEGTEGLSERMILAALVTRDSMIGTGLPGCHHDPPVHDMGGRFGDGPIHSRTRECACFCRRLARTGAGGDVGLGFSGAMEYRHLAPRARKAVAQGLRGFPIMRNGWLALPICWLKQACADLRTICAEKPPMQITRWRPAC